MVFDKKRNVFVYFWVGLHLCLRISSQTSTHVTSTPFNITSTNTSPFTKSPNNTTIVQKTTIATSKKKIAKAHTKKTIIIPEAAKCHLNESLNHDKGIASNFSCHDDSAPMICFSDPLNCKKHSWSFKRSLFEVPAFGEYKYLTHKKWFPIITQGGIAFLYHPCTHKDEKKKLRSVANACLRRYIISPSEYLSKEKPIVLVTWGCFYRATFVNATDMKLWLRKHSLRGPASNVPVDGKFEGLLKQRSGIVTDIKDSIVCPTEQEISKFFVTTIATRKKPNHRKISETILDNRAKKIQEKHKKTVGVSVKSMKVHAGNATWAAFSLFFLCGILCLWLVYTKYWSPEKKQSYDYEQIMTYDNERDDYGDRAFSASGGFSLLKSSQQVINIFKSSRKKRDKKLDSLSTVNFMVPISEDDEDEEIDT